MFKTLKKAFTTMPVVTHWIPGSPLIIEMNALDYTLATILSTISPTNNEIHPIAFHSCTLTSTKPNYDIHDNELLAIFEALKIWQHYLKGSLTLIDIVMDHKNPVHSCDIFLNTTTTYCRRLTIYHVKSSGNGSLMRPDGHLLLFSESNNRRLCRTLFPGCTRPRPKLGQHAPHNLIYWAHRHARRRCAANTDSTTTEAVSMPDAPTAPTLHHIGFRNFIHRTLRDRLQCRPTQFSHYQHRWAGKTDTVGFPEGTMCVYITTPNIFRCCYRAHAGPSPDAVNVYGDAWMPPTTWHTPCPPF